MIFLESKARVLGPCIAFSVAKSLQGGGLSVSFSFIQIAKQSLAI
jgi:hypothetical protein